MIPLEKAGRPHAKDTCETASNVTMTCTSGCGFSYSAADVGVFTHPRDKQKEVCVDDQTEFMSQAETHHRQFAGIGKIYDERKGTWRIFNDSDHNEFTLEATVKGLRVILLPIIAR